MISVPPIADKPTRDTDQDDQKLIKKIKNYIYDPNEIIGSGFSSHVYKGINQQTGETVAIKVLELNKIQNQVEKYLLNNQINALRALNHPNVLKTIEILMTKNNVYLMTQFCEKGDLQQLVKQHQKLNEIDALHIIRDIAEGYKAVQEKNILHRDLKTANIFLTNTGARIADFGFCQFIGDKKPEIAYNVGSPAYMSPESYKENVYSPKSDIWSIGIILYEMLIGETPDKNLTYTQMVTNLMNGRINCGSSQEIKSILTRCFKRDLNERISIHQLLEAVNHEIHRLEAINPNKFVASISNSQAKHSPIIQPHLQQNVQPNQIKFVSKVPLNNVKLLSTSETHVKPPMMSSMQPVNLDEQTHFGQPNFINRNSSPIKNNSYKALIQNEIKNNDLSQSPSKQDQRFSYKAKQQQKILKKSDLPLLIFQNNNQKLKPYIETLLYLFRLLKYLAESNLQKPQYVKLILFRHRSFLESLVERILAENSIDRNNCQAYKEFQFLKSRFDETYLLREQSSVILHQNPYRNSQNPNHQIMKQLNELANTTFNEPKAIQVYSQIMLDAVMQCEMAINKMGFENLEGQQVGVLWDYVMIELQILDLHKQGLQIENIVQQLNLQSIMKEHPQKLVAVHFQLLRLKYKHLSEALAIESNQSSQMNEENHLNMNQPTNLGLGYMGVNKASFSFMN